jgi:hypothetical protein
MNGIPVASKMIAAFSLPSAPHRTSLRQLLLRPGEPSLIRFA